MTAKTNDKIILIVYEIYYCIPLHSFLFDLFPSPFYFFHQHISLISSLSNGLLFVLLFFWIRFVRFLLLMVCFLFLCLSVSVIFLDFSSFLFYICLTSTEFLFFGWNEPTIFGFVRFLSRI